MLSYTDIFYIFAEDTGAVKPSSHQYNYHLLFILLPERIFFIVKNSSQNNKQQRQQQ